MVKRTFNYRNFSTIEIDAPKDVLDRIAYNLEGEQKNIPKPNCKIKINESNSPVEIQKNRNYEYLSIEESGNVEESSLKYYRYNTHIRTINQKCPNSYEVYSNTLLDEDSGLLCVRNHLNNNLKIAEHPLLHASLININGKGILIPGCSKQGKTTLTTYLLQEQGGVLISDENVVLDTSKEKLRGIYVPKKIRVRFSAIAKSNLSNALGDLTLTDATQYLDTSYIKEVIENRNFESEWGLAFSRKSFCDLIGASSSEESQIDMVVFPKYQEGKEIGVREIGLEEGIKKISEAGLIKKSHLNPRELEGTVLDLKIPKEKRLEFIEISFSGMDTLFRKGFKI